MIMGFFSKLRKGLEKTKHSLIQNIETVVRGYAKIDDDMYDDLEAVMLTGDMGVETTEYLLDQIRTGVKNRDIKDGNDVVPYLEGCIVKLLNENDEPLPETEGTRVIFVVGVNGVGKTTTIGKLAHRLSGEGKRVLLCAADTFRAAAADQLEIWAGRANVDIVRQHEGADPAAVVFDAISAAKARGSDVILCDTAGRLHNKANLMNELGKISRIIDRELPNADKEVLLVLDGTTGQNGLLQAKQFKEIAGVTAIALTKLDGTAKGGIVIAVADALQIPVKLIGVGEQMDDLMPFEPRAFVDALI